MHSLSFGSELGRMETQVFEASGIDLAQYVTALRRAFQTSAWADEIGASMTEEFYRWKYNTPAGAARIARVLSDGAPISGVSAFPLLLGGGKREPEVGWQIGDIMTVPEMRGQGLYTKCLGALVEALDDQLLFCFPNERSRRAIERSGFLRVADVDTYVQPIFAAGRPEVSQVLDLDQIDGPIDPASESWLGVFKDRSYLSWRYRHHPHGIYRAIGDAKASRS
jgi:RimJ/RimL family protein N-acetyltransferase